MRNEYMVLEGHELRPVDVLEWARWFEKADRRVARETVGDVEVSTVCLGSDHGFGGRPLWFETMLFGGTTENECWRYATWDEAEAGHRAVVAALRDGTLLP